MSDDYDDRSRVIDAIANYAMPPEAVKLIKKTPLLLVAGTAGAGKNSIIQKLVESGRYYFMISYTTRQRRQNHGKLEEDGSVYHFITWSQAAHMIETEQFIEAKLVHGQHLYGSAISELKATHDSEKVGVTDIDVQGVAEYKSVNPSAKAIFVVPPSFEEWLKRIESRGGLDQDGIRQRLRSAEAEIEHAIKAKYFNFVINDNLDDAVKQTEEIIESSPPEAVWNLLGRLKRELNS